MNTLRPDELANLGVVEQSQKRDRLLRGAGSLALGAGIGSRILPFINQFIPPDLAMKGINKISPVLGSLLKKGQEKGLDVQEGLNFIKTNILRDADKERNIIQQESPELHQFIDQEIRGGMTPLQAGAKASVDKKFTDVIKKLVKTHKMPWSNILETIYGSGEQALPKSPQPQGQQQQPGQGQQALMSILSQINQRLGQ